MKLSVSTAAVLVLISLIAVCAAMPRDALEQQQQNVQQTSEQLIDGSNTWNAIRNWFRPATTYIQDSLPDMTPSDLASDVRDAAVDLRDRTRDHPAVQTVVGAVRPVQQWFSDAADTISKTSFREMYDNVSQRVNSADENVADWINSRSYNSDGMPQAQNIEILQ